MKFSQEDLETALKFAKENDNSNFEDWLKYRKSILTEEDKKIINSTSIYEKELDGDFSIAILSNPQSKVSEMDRVMEIYLKNKLHNQFVRSDLTWSGLRIVTFGTSKVKIEDSLNGDKYTKVRSFKLDGGAKMDATLCYPDTNEDGDYIIDKYSPNDIAQRCYGDYWEHYVEIRLDNPWFTLHIQKMNELYKYFKPLKEVVNYEV